MPYKGFMDILGWCPPAKADRLEQLAKSCNCIVEIGVFHGQSFFALAHGASKNCLLFAIDPWSQEEAKQASAEGAETKWDFREAGKRFHWKLREYGFEHQTTVIKMTSKQAFEAIEYPPIDLLHIDGNHDADKVNWDVENWIGRVRPGGIIVLDDIDWATIRPTWHWLKTQCSHVEEHPTWGFGVII